MKVIACTVSVKLPGIAIGRGKWCYEVLDPGFQVHPAIFTPAIGIHSSEAEDFVGCEPIRSNL